MELIAMPSLCDSTSFGLENEKFNRECGLKWVKRKPLVIEEFEASTLYRCGNHHDGFFFLWDHADQLVGYYIRYELKKTKIHGISVTQTALWRSLTSPNSRGLTKHVIYNYLLKEWPAILSDSIQTEDGKRFWIDRMSEALTLGYSVLLVDFNHQKIHAITTNAELRLWATDKAEGAWSWKSNKHKGLRFMITQKDAMEAA